MVIRNKEDDSNMEYIALNAAMQKEKQKMFLDMKQSEAGAALESGVMFIRNIPHGFYEKEMKGYFSQFGRVTKVKLARKRKDGSSRGFAYLEFADREIAKIAAETMNNYVMFEKCLKCELLPQDKVPEDAFKPNVIEYRAEDANKDYWNVLNKPLTSEQLERRRKRLNKYLTDLQAQYNELGIEYDWDDLKANPDFIPPTQEANEEASSVSDDEDQSEDLSMEKRFREFVEDFDFYYSERGTCMIREHVDWKNKAKKPRKKKRKSVSKTKKKTGKKANNQRVPIIAPDEELKKRMKLELEKTSVGKITMNETPEIIVDDGDDEITFKTPETIKVKKRHISPPTPVQMPPEQTPKRRKSLGTVASAKGNRKQLKKMKLEQMRQQLNMSV